MNRVALSCVCVLSIASLIVGCDDETSTAGDPGGTAGNAQGAGGSGAGSTGGSTSDGGTSTSGGSGPGGSGSGGDATGGNGSGGAGDCYSTDACDPLDPGSCGSAGDACDLGGSPFMCVGGSNTETVGAACNANSGPFCMHGLTCVSDVCREYCCSNFDCSENTCQIHPESGAAAFGVTVCIP